MTTLLFTISQWIMIIVCFIWGCVCSVKAPTPFLYFCMILFYKILPLVASFYCAVYLIAQYM